MPANALDRQLTQLEASRYRFGPDEAASVVKLLNRLDAAHFPGGVHDTGGAYIAHPCIIV